MKFSARKKDRAAEKLARIAREELHEQVRELAEADAEAGKMPRGFEEIVIAENLLPGYPPPPIPLAIVSVALDLYGSMAKNEGGAASLVEQEAALCAAEIRDTGLEEAFRALWRAANSTVSDYLSESMFVDEE